MTVSISEVKNFWNNRPCNVKHSSKPIGSKEYFDEVEEKKFFVEPHIKTFSKFNLWNGKKVLEIGCGLATAGINFARYGADYTGVELSKESLDLAKKRFEVYNCNANFYSGNLETLSTFVPVNAVVSTLVNPESDELNETLIVPFPFVIPIFEPAPKVFFVRVLPDELPISN